MEEEPEWLEEEDEWLVGVGFFWALKWLAVASIRAKIAYPGNRKWRLRIAVIISPR